MSGVDLLALAERVEASAGADRGLFEQAFLAIYPRVYVGSAEEVLMDRCVAMLDAGAYLDAAMTLVPEGLAELTVRSLPQHDVPHHFAYIRRPLEMPFTGNARSQALALTAACLRARHQSAAGEGEERG